MLPRWPNRPKPVKSVAYCMMLLHITFDAVSFQFVIKDTTSYISHWVTYFFAVKVIMPAQIFLSVSGHPLFLNNHLNSFYQAELSHLRIDQILTLHQR